VGPRGSWRKVGEYRARQGRGVMDLDCWVRCAPGGIKRRMRGVLEEASDAKVVPAVRHGFMHEQGNNLGRTSKNEPIQ